LSIGNVSNQQLNALYARAACLVFPSLYEGFGWPVLEAAIVKTPVACSARGSLMEVAGDLACFINPSNEMDAAKKLADYLLAAMMKLPSEAEHLSKSDMVGDLMVIYARL